MTGPSRQMSSGPSWQWPHSPTPHCMFRSSDTRMFAAGMPLPSNTFALKRIIGSGPQRNAIVRSGSTGTRASGSVTKPTGPDQPSAGTSTVCSTSRSGRAVHSASWSVNRNSSGARAPVTSTIRRYASRLASAPSSTGRSGARPTPPATMTRSWPTAVERPQVVPNGPRTPTTSPGAASCSARLTAPTSRIVWLSAPSPSDGSPLIEIAISPTPRAYSMVNWPGRKAGIGASTGSRRSVAESCVSSRREATRYGTGTIGSRSSNGSHSTVTGAPVQVEQPRPGALQALQDGLEEAERERVAQCRVRVGERLEPLCVQLDGGDLLSRDSAEVPAVRRHQPRPAQHVARTEGLHDDRPAPGHDRVQCDPAGPDQPAAASRLSLVEDPLAGGEGDFAGRAGDLGSLLLGQRAEQWQAGKWVRHPSLPRRVPERAPRPRR